MEFQENINDLKSVSFDLLYSQVSSLIASYNELKVSGKIDDAFEKRLLLLQGTISNMKNLIQSVEDFNDLDENVIEKNNSFDVKEVVADNKSSEEATTNTSGIVFSAPLISSTPTSSGSIINDSSNTSVQNVSSVTNEDSIKPVIENTSVPSSGSIINDSGNTSVQNVSSVTNEDSIKPVIENTSVPSSGSIINDSSNTSTQSDIGSLIFSAPANTDVTPISPDGVTINNNSVAVEEAPIPVSSNDMVVGNSTVAEEAIPTNFSSENAISVSVPPEGTVPVSVSSEDTASVGSSEQVIAPVNPADVNVRAIASLEKFRRISDSPVKAIIVNDSQFNKLVSSLGLQTEQLDFGASSSDENMSVEAMIEKANDLYSQGNKQAAEEIYNKINSMTLVKKAA